MSQHSSRIAARVLVSLGAVFLAGCLVGANEIRFETGEFGRAYVPGQITSALQNVGYSQMPFKSFKSDNEVTRTLRVDDETEMRYLRRGEPTYIIVATFNTQTTRVLVRLAEDGRESLSEQGEAELALIRKALREQFGPHVVQ